MQPASLEQRRLPIWSNIHLGAARRLAARTPQILRLDREKSDSAGCRSKTRRFARVLKFIVGRLGGSTSGGSAKIARSERNQRASSGIDGTPPHREPALPPRGENAGRRRSAGNVSGRRQGQRGRARLCGACDTGIMKSVEAVAGARGPCPAVRALDRGGIAFRQPGKARHRRPSAIERRAEPPAAASWSVACFAGARSGARSSVAAMSSLRNQRRIELGLLHTLISTSASTPFFEDGRMRASRLMAPALAPASWSSIARTHGNPVFADLPSALAGQGTCRRIARRGRLSRCDSPRYP